MLVLRWDKCWDIQGVWKTKQTWDRSQFHKAAYKVQRSLVYVDCLGARILGGASFPADERCTKLTTLERAWERGWCKLSNYAKTWLF
jgi:hypothetical protein